MIYGKKPKLREKIVYGSEISVWGVSDIFNIYDCSACSDQLPTCRITFSCNSGSQRHSFVFLYNFRYLKFSN